MAAIQFEQPIEGELTLSRPNPRPVLVLGIFESGKVALITENGELQVTDEPLRVFIPDWPVEKLDDDKPAE